MDRFGGTAARDQRPFVPTSSAAVGTIVAGGRYALHDRIAAGGMASVHIGRLRGEGGFARIVAIKRLHPHLCQDPSFVSMFLDEARLVARIRHPNVVPTLDVVAADGEMLLVMEYVPGESLARLSGTLTAEGEIVPTRIAAAIVCGALHGLHAAHEARDEHGAALHIVHRDVSPQNILVGVDGVARLLDFGVAKARSRLSQTRDGEIKGKLAYMAPEQLRDRAVDRTTDVYAAGVVLWEVLTGQRFHGDASEASIVERVLYGKVQPPTALVPSLPASIDEVTLRALARDPADRYPTAREMAEALEASLGAASMSDMGAWVAGVARSELARRAAVVAKVETSGASAEAASNRRAVSSDSPASGMALEEDTHPEAGRPSHAAALAYGLESGADGAFVTERTTRRGARVGVGLLAVAVVVGAFAVARSVATAPSAGAAPLDPAPSPSASAANGGAPASLAAAPAPTSVVTMPSVTALVTSTSTPAAAPLPTVPGAPSAPPANRRAGTPTPTRHRGGKVRSALPDDLPSDRE